MVRRTAILGVVVFALMAGSAFAATTWHTQMKDGSATASRSTSKCTVGAGSASGSLRVTCKAGGKATLHYLFTSAAPVLGKASSSVDAASTGSTSVGSTVSVGVQSLRVTVTVAGAGSAQVSSVSVGYYTK
jgi:hypothetical protein